MYERNILIKGKHATYMKELVANIDTNIGQGIFKRNLDVYLMAPIVGMLYGRLADQDNSSADSTSIHTEQLLGESEELEANYRTIMLLHDQTQEDIEKRIERAFKYDRNEEKRKMGDDIFERYMLGGIEVLHEKLLDNAKDMDDIVMKLFEFINDFDQRYLEKIAFDELERLCQKSAI